MFRYIKNKYKSLGIAKKILHMLLLASVFPILIIDVITCAIVANTLQSQTNELMESSMMLSQKSLEDYFEVYERIIMSIYSKNVYATNLKKLNTWDSKNYYFVKNEIEKDLQDIAYIYPNILGIAVVTQKKEVILYDSLTLTSTNSYCFNADEREWREVAESTFNHTQTIYSAAIHKEDKNGTQRDVIYLAHRLTDLNNYKNGTVGSIIICIDESDVREVYSQQKSESTNLSFLLDRDGNIVSCSKKELVGIQILPEMWQDAEFDRKTAITEAVGKFRLTDSPKYNIYTKPVLDSKFIQVTIQDTAEQLKSILYIAQIVILIGILTVIASFIVVVRFADSIQEIVQKIICAMDKAYKGDYSVQIVDRREDEFGKISSHFNHMVQKIDQSAKQEKESLLREKNAEIKALEAQINPHFLYNTLDAINWIAIEKEQFQISKMLKNLAIILRYSIHKSNEVVNIEDELEYLKKYIYLQQQRFEFSFQCILNIEEELLQYKIHKLLFQPLIENAIVHGFPGNSGQDVIKIDMKKKDDKHLRIRVEDNGKGMSPELVETLNHFDYRENSIESSIGVRNVIMRIKYYYGDEGSFSIESGESGTIIEAQILME